ncbi:type VI secretion system contractile sheath domain-containing protein [Oceanospirillum sp.]|uniref:type VI secretion system contractile sheath domain-containing protein n=1 Tax=Oceanospirillum sp. TaxID=2021254 RepID=UPI003A91CA81
MDSRNALIASLMIRPQEQEAQLPCRVLFAGAYAGNVQNDELIFRQIRLNLQKPEQAMHELGCAVDFSEVMPEWREPYEIRTLEDFHPSALIQRSPLLSYAVNLRDQLLADISPSESLLAEAKDFLERYSPLEPAQQTDDFLYADLEVCLTDLLSQLLHCPAFTQLESLWRQLYALCESVRYHKASDIVLLNCSKADLVDDLAGEMIRSELYERVYSREFGQFGGQPFNMLVVDFYMEQTEQDLSLLQTLSDVGCSAHLPVVAPVSPHFIGFNGYEQLLGQSLDEWFENPRFMPLHRLAEQPRSRYLFLVLPDQVTRAPYHGSFSGFFFQEQVDADGCSLLWGSSCYSLAATVLNTFDNQSSFSQMTGSFYGRELLHKPWQDPMADMMLSPLEVDLPTSLVTDLSRHGFCVLSALPEENSSYFPQLNSLHQLALSSDKAVPDAQLPYLLTICRVAHMMKRVFREQIGSMDEPEQLRQKLEQWLKSFVVDLESPALDVMMKKPFRQADVILRRAEGCLMEVRLQPHLRYMDERFQLSLDLILQEVD